MPLNDNLKIKNANSLIRQKATRSRRDADRKVNDRRKDLLQAATSASERRKIKSGVYDLDTTRTDDNKQGTDERIQNDGIDKLYSPAPSSSGGGGGGGDLPVTPDSEGLYALVNVVTMVDGVPTGQIFWQKTESC